jgi:signal transduction histidine kinase/streptogramin lyase
MINRKKILLFFLSLSCFAFHHLFAQQIQNKKNVDQYRAINWTMDDGLSADRLHTMIKDAKGFIWVGSDFGGFCRFDGARFKTYLPEPNNRNTINSDKIKSFTEDSLHNIWIGTDKGLSRYDFKADTFTNYSPWNNSAAAIVPIGSTKDTIFCIEPGAWITAFDIHTCERKKIVQVSKEVDMSNHYNTNKSFFDAGSNSIWKLSFYGEQLVVLEQISLDNGETEKYSWPCYRNNVKHRHTAEDIVYDSKRNSIWVNSGDGLLEFSLHDKQFHKIEAFNEMIKTKDFDRGVGIDIDINGRVWLSTYDGILIYDPKTKAVRPVFSDPDLQKKAGDANLHIYCDREGIVWTASWFNYSIYEILPHNPPFERFSANPKKQDSLSNHAIYSIIPVANDEMWIGTQDGLNIFNTKTDKFQVLRQKDLPGISGNFIVPVYVDTIRQKAWLRSATSGASEDEMDLYEMDLKTRQSRPIVFRDGTKLLDTISARSEYFLPYKNGLIICERHGIFEIKENSLFADLVVSFNLGFSRMLLEEDRFIFLQVGGTHLTFENKNGKWIKTPHLLDIPYPVAIFYNKKDQTHWVSFKFELVHYSKDFRKIKTYRQEDGYNGIAFNMILDDDGNLWFTNNLHQISRLNTTTGIISTISETYGYQKQNFDWYVPTAKDDKGNLYFGTKNFGRTTGGLDRIYPERYSSTVTSSVYLRSLAINQKPLPLSVGINNLEKLSLRYNQNTINIETGIIDFYAKGKGHIRYKLKENDNEGNWQYGDAYHTIRYEKLPPGKYELVLQASNTGNEFNSAEKKLMINISPPFWQTWWFRILAVVMAIAIIYGIIQYRSRSLKQRNIQLEEKVMVRTKELKHSLEELRETQAQLIQREKMASLGELTAGIAHEIQNPLNFVNNFSEVNAELIAEMKQEIDKGNIEEVKLIAGDIEKNEQKINHHGSRADAIIKGMLQHSRTSPGQKEPTDINALAEEYLRLSYHGLRAKDKTFNATIQTDFDQNLEKINIIPQDVGRVLLNLINNAFYAVSEKKNLQPEGYEPTVSVSTKKLNGKSDRYRIEISVKDNGTGIPQKILDKIYQPFFTTKPTGQGTGLGLSLAYDVIKAHGGEIKVETKEDRGAEFIIQLPAT